MGETIRFGARTICQRTPEGSRQTVIHCDSVLCSCSSSSCVELFRVCSSLFVAFSFVVADCDARKRELQGTLVRERLRNRRRGGRRCRVRHTNSFQWYLLFSCLSFFVSFAVCCCCAFVFGFFCCCVVLVCLNRVCLLLFDHAVLLRAISKYEKGGDEKTERKSDVKWVNIDKDQPDSPAWLQDMLKNYQDPKKVDKIEKVRVRALLLLLLLLFVAVFVAACCLFVCFVPVVAVSVVVFAGLFVCFAAYWLCVIV